VRQAVVASDADAPDGSRYLLFSNSQPGRPSQALQALGVDGDQVAAIDVSIWTRTHDVHAGGSVDDLPIFYIMFFDAERAPIGKAVLGPWSGESAWTQHSARIKVPRACFLAVVTLTMEGATGEFAVDDVRVRQVLKSNVKER
jgi:protein-L-isoaspartate(D-aspartate) O-methyltransferase